MDIKLVTGKVISVSGRENILGALKRHGIYLVSSCGGKGTCGKCMVRLIEGTPEMVSHGKLTPKQRESGIVLACQSYPADDVLIEIPESSRLVVGEKIAVSRSKDLAELFKSFATGIEPIVKTIDLELPPPTIEDSISDLERLKRATGPSLGASFENLEISPGFAASMSKALRDAGWKITLGYIDGDPPEAVFITPQSKGGRYGIAVDIGTTTVVLYLVDLKDGRLIDVGSTYNSQMRYGDDVITRIVHATEKVGGGGLDELRGAAREDINDLLRAVLDRHGIGPKEVESATISGNTTMTHLFWGLDPASIREEPYIPTINFYPLWKAETAGLEMNPLGPVYTLPSVASYVGGDIVSGVLASKMNRSAEVALFMDIGTNGEIAVGNNEWLVTAACSAGPCFEGSGIRHGMRATEGAIETVRINPSTLEPEIGVIGDVKPIGICGSGMIDAISEMFITGVIDRKGKLLKGKTERVRDGEEGPEYVLTGDITLTEADIENVLRAKAAMYAGVSLLVKEVGLSLDALKKVYIAGGFGNYLNVERAITLGMLPDLPLDRYVFLGNTSVAGAYLTLLSGDLRKEAEKIAGRMTYIELSASTGFMDEYMSALFLPHTDMSRFPTVEKLLTKR